MKKAIELDKDMIAGYIRDGLVTEKEVADIRSRFDGEWPGMQAVDRQQRVLNAVLALARPRMDEKDSRGRPLLTADEFVARGLVDAKGAVKYPIEDRALVPTLSEGIHYRDVDHGIAPLVTRMTQAGYHSAASCSGLLADHPNYRYVMDSEEGRYRKGEPICYNKQGSQAYIAFYKEPKNDGWDLGLPGNTPEQIEDIRQVAEEIGWVVEESQTYFRDSIQLYMPVTLDGTGRRELLKEANALVDKQYPGLQKEDFLKWLDIRDKTVWDVYERHGGVVMLTDDMIKGYWVALASKLELAAARRADMVEERLAATEIPELIWVDTEVHRPQLKQILQRQGYRLADKALDGLPLKEGTSLLQHCYLQVDTDGKHVYKVPERSVRNTDSKIHTLSFMAARQMISDVQVTAGPVGQGATVSCRMDGQQQPPKQLSSGVISAYAMGKLDDMQVAVAHFADRAMELTRVQIELVNGHGRRMNDGVTVTLTGDKNRQGEFFYKDYDAFGDRKDICYVSSAALKYAETPDGAEKEDTALTHSVPMAQVEGYGMTWQDMVETARIYGFGPDRAERAAEIMFRALEGQSADAWMMKNKDSVMTQMDEEDRIMEAGIVQPQGKQVSWKADVTVRVDRCMDFGTLVKVLESGGLKMPSSAEADLPVDRNGWISADYLAFEKDIFRESTDEYECRDAGDEKDTALLSLADMHDRMRVTDVSVRRVADGEAFLHCSIDNRVQPRKKLEAGQVDRAGDDNIGLAVNVHKRLLDDSWNIQLNNGIKR